MPDLTNEQSQSIKRSYLNILALFLSEDKIQSRYLRCLLKWGFQLKLDNEDLKAANINFSELKFFHPDDKLGKIEGIFHLVQMIHLDHVVEDVELEVATMYANKLGFKNTLVSELFKSIATEQPDETNPGNVRQQVMDFLKVHEG